VAGTEELENGHHVPDTPPLLRRMIPGPNERNSSLSANAHNRSRHAYVM
jgi:hypothetical protein